MTHIALTFLRNGFGYNDMNGKPAHKTALEKIDQFLNMAEKTSVPPGQTREVFIRDVDWRIGFTYDELLVLKGVLMRKQ